MSIPLPLLIFMFGGFGALSRFYMDQLFTSSSSWPWATFLVNIVGSFLFGMTLQLFQADLISENWKAVLCVGFLGGLTTFSSFTAQNYGFLERKEYLLFGSYTLASIAISLVFFVVGHRWIKI